VVLRALIVLLVTAASALYARDLVAQRAYTAGIPDLGTVPAAFPGWSSEEVPLSDNVAQVLGADAMLQRRYRDQEGREVWLFVAYFAQQTVNAQIHSPRHCVPGSGWDIVSVAPAALHPPGRVQPVTRMRIARPGAVQDLYYWFRTRGGTVTGEYALKWDLLRNSLARRPTDAVFVRIAGTPGQEDALAGVLAGVDQPLHQALARVGLQ
jgi:EpsI family protein